MPTEHAPLFVSHSSQDDAIVTRIHDRLTDAGIDTWVDHVDGVKLGDRFHPTIQIAANNCKCGLFVLSPDSAKSRYCEAEWSRIINLDKLLLVALVAPVPIEDIPLLIDTIHRIDLQHDFDEGMNELIHDIRNQHGRELDPAAPTTGVKQRITGDFPQWQRDLPIIGRDDELETVRQALQGNRRMTSVLGFGGIGKTRLAAEIALTSTSRDGVVWQSIHETSTVADLTQSIREHLGLDPGLDDEAVWTELGRRDLLIVLDNAEDCTQDAARADYVRCIDHLDLTGGTRVLMTGRERWREGPHGTQNVELVALAPDAAADLVHEMIRYEPPIFSLAGHERALAEAARYHPRLIWYAVKWANDAPPDEVLDMLAHLTGDDPEKALENLVGKTIARMTERTGDSAAVEALRRLAVCRGGFTREAARALLPDLAALKPLMDWGLVRYAEQRYAIDPLVMRHTGEDPTAYRAHYDFYHALARQHDERQDYLGLDVESENLAAAFERMMDRGAAEAAYWLANACGHFLANRGRFAQRMAWFERVEKALADHPEDELRANVQNSLGIVYQGHPTGERRANLQRAIAAYEQALVYWTPEAAPLDYARTQNNLGIAYRALAQIKDRKHNLRRAIAAYEQALEHYTPQAAPLRYAMTQNNLGTAYSNLAQIEDPAHNLQRAIAAYEQALVYWTPQAAPLRYAMTQNNLGLAYRNLAQIEDPAHNLQRAIAAFEQALEHYTPQAAPLDYATTQNNLGNAYRDLAQREDPAHNLQRAIAAFEQALVYWTPETAPLDYATTQNNLGIAYHNLAQREDPAHNLQRAIAAYEQALKHYTSETAPLHYAMTQANLGLAREDQGDRAAAVTCWREAERYFRQMDMAADADKILRWIEGAE